MSCNQITLEYCTQIPQVLSRGLVATELRAWEDSSADKKCKKIISLTTFLYFFSHLERKEKNSL